MHPATGTPTMRVTLSQFTCLYQLFRVRAGEYVSHLLSCNTQKQKIELTSLGNVFPRRIIGFAPVGLGGFGCRGGLRGEILGLHGQMTSSWLI